MIAFILALRLSSLVTDHRVRSPISPWPYPVFTELSRSMGCHLAIGFSRRTKPGMDKKCPWGRGLESNSVGALCPSPPSPLAFFTPQILLASGNQGRPVELGELPRQTKGKNRRLWTVYYSLYFHACYSFDSISKKFYFVAISHDKTVEK